MDFYNFNKTKNINNNNYIKGDYVKYTKEKSKGYSSDTLFVYTLNNVSSNDILPAANNKSTPYFFREKTAVNKCKKINESLLKYNNCQYDDLYKVVKYRLEAEYDVYIPAINGR